MYHRIAEDRFDPWGLAVSPANFADQLQWLASKRMVLPLPEFAKRHREGTLARNAAAITFDDGYESTAAVAAPLLEQSGLPATVFLPIALIERGEPFWWDDLQRIIFGFSGKSLSVGGEDVNLGNRSRADAEWPPFEQPRTPRQAAFHRIWTMLRYKPPAQLEAIMQSLRQQVGDARWLDLDRPMAPEQVRAIASERIEFGSHALTHPSLPTLGEAEKATEIKSSIARVRSLTGTDPLAFAYPYGDRDEGSEKLVEQAGFLCACATDERPVSRHSDLFALPRLGIGNVGARQLARQLATP